MAAIDERHKVFEAMMALGEGPTLGFNSKQQKETGFRIRIRSAISIGSEYEN